MITSSSLLTIAEYIELGETESGYQNAPDVTGTFTAVEPFDLRIQVDPLLN